MRRAPPSQGKHQTLERRTLKGEQVKGAQGHPPYDELPQTYVCSFTVLTLLLHSVKTAFF